MTSCQKKYGRDARIVVVFFALFFFCFPKIVSLRNMTAERRRRKRFSVTNVTELLVACFVVIFTEHYCVLFLFKER